MAPHITESAHSSHPASHKPTGRIVPAIPLALSRTTRPITPDETERINTVHYRESREKVADAKAAKALGEPKVAREPLTPDSNPSEFNHVMHNSEGKDAEEKQHISLEEVENNQGTSRVDIHKIMTENLSSSTSANGLSAPKEQKKRHKASHAPQLSESHPTRKSMPSSTTASPHPSLNASIANNPSYSGKNIIFSGYSDSSSSSPMPPVAADGVTYPPPPPPPLPPPGYLPGTYGPHTFFHGHHVHNMADSTRPFVYPPMVMPPPEAYGFRKGHTFGHPSVNQAQLPASINSQLPFRLPHTEVVPQSRSPRFLNGAGHASRSPSQASISTQDQELHSHSVNIDQRTEQLDSRNYQPSQYDADMLRLSVVDDAAQGLRDYLCSQFGNSDFADFILELTFRDDKKPIIEIPIHAVIAARSPRIFSMINTGAPGNDTVEQHPKRVKAKCTDKFLDTFSLTEALRYLYGAPLFDIRDITLGLQPFIDAAQQIESFDLARRRMDHVIAYAAAGFYLQVPNIIHRGLSIAKELLRWDTVERALVFALDGGVSRVWGSQNPLTPPKASRFDEQPYSYAEYPLPTEFADPSYGLFSIRFLHDIIDYIVFSIPPDFSLFSTASQLMDIQPFPDIPESKPSHNPKLSQIQFGDVPIASNSSSTFVSRLISSVLFSLPFPVLKSFLEHPRLGERLGWDKVFQLMTAVIEERDTRRRRALKSWKRLSGADVNRKQVWQDLEWSEQLQESAQHPSGFRLTRRPSSAREIAFSDQ